METVAFISWPRLKIPLLYQCVNNFMVAGSLTSYIGHATKYIHHHHLHPLSFRYSGRSQTRNTIINLDKNVVKPKITSLYERTSVISEYSTYTIYIRGDICLKNRNITEKNTRRIFIGQKIIYSLPFNNVKIIFTLFTFVFYNALLFTIFKL